MDQQVETVLQISLLEKGQLKLKFEETDINTLISGAIEHMKKLVESRRGTIIEDLTNKIVKAKVDEFHMQNIIINILENANKYSTEKPNITIKTEDLSKNIKIEIKDKGLGMTKHEQRHIFDKFYRTHTGNIHNIKGHGLGLAYVKTIVDMHGGKIFIDSEKGKGSKFTIFIPKNN